MGFNGKLVLFLISLAGFYVCSESLSSDNYPGVIELVGYSNRRARTYYAPLENKSKKSPGAAKIKADIETVKQNIEKYNKLLTLDTKNLPESQKDMLERIVERVARLKESLDIAEPLKEKANATKTAEVKETKAEAKESGEVEDNSTMTPTDKPANFEETEEEDKTEPTLVLDETTLLQLQSSMDKLAAAQAAVTSQGSQQMKEFPVTTEMMPEDNLPEEQQLTTESTGFNEEDEEEYEGTTMEPSTDTTDPAEQFVAARSNNNVAGITAASDEAETMATLSTTIGSQRTLTTSGKTTKTRATKRPNNKTANSKRRPSTSSLNKNKQKLNTNSAVTQQYQKLAQKTQQQQPSALQYNQQQQQQQQPVMLQNSYQSQPPKAVSPSSLSLDKYNSNAAAAAAASISNGPAAASYGINPVNNIPSVSLATNSLPVNAAYGVGAGSSPSLSSSAASTASQDLVYDAHVNASAIIDSLNNNAREEYYQQKQSLQTGVATKDKKPITGAKPTKYHYYPHNQHIYLLPECAIQQVCNAVYVRLNYTQPLCACPSRYRDPCSASLNEDDQHTTKLVGDGKKKAITLAKTCEATTEMRECRTPKDWSLLALQNTRTGKSHYLVICRCPDHFKMEGPMAHDQPTYASVPGIRVFGMMCVKPGYSVRKPSAQPPKRYQLQKPFYRPGSQTSYVQNNIGNNKDAYGRPSYGSSSSSQNSHISSSSNNFNSAASNSYHGAETYQSQGNYQYLNRPESISSSAFNSNNNNYRPEPVSINNFPGAGYGRNNEREGDAPIEAATEIDNKLLINTSTQAAEDTNTTLSEDTTKSEELKREKRSLSENTIDFDDETPAFPWDRVIEFEKTLIWD